MILHCSFSRNPFLKISHRVNVFMFSHIYSFLVVIFPSHIFFIVHVRNVLLPEVDDSQTRFRCVLENPFSTNDSSNDLSKSYRLVLNSVTMTEEKRSSGLQPLKVVSSLLDTILMLVKGERTTLHLCGEVLTLYLPYTLYSMSIVYTLCLYSLYSMSVVYTLCL